MSKGTNYRTKPHYSYDRASIHILLYVEDMYNFWNELSKESTSVHFNKYTLRGSNLN